MAAIKPDDLASVLAKELAAYDQEVTDGIKAAVEAAAKAAVKAVKSVSPKLTGDYKKGWTKKKAYEDQRDIRIVVHNPKEYPLTHLLEHGHAKRGGGRVAGVPHIAKAEQEAADLLENKAKVVIQG